MWRTERDSAGEVRLDANSLWGIRSERARLLHGGGRLPATLWEMIGIVLRSAAMTNEDFGFLTVDRGEWISMAAQEVVDGILLEHLIAGPDWSAAEVFENGVEVVTNRTLECMGGELGSGDPVHPQKHVALHLQAEPVMDLAVRLAVARRLESRWVSAYHQLFPALERLLSVPESAWGPPGWDQRFWGRIAEFSALDLRMGGEARWKAPLMAALAGPVGTIPPDGDWPAFGTRILEKLG